MNRKKRKKPFSGIEMKRKIQAEIAEETKGMSVEERVEYFKKKVIESPYASLFKYRKSRRSSMIVREKK